MSNPITPDGLRQVAAVILAVDKELAGMVDADQLAGFLPATLMVLRIVVRARLQCPGPPPMYVNKDGSESPFNE